jgi:predicted RNA binding protein YcfA (HicA-like mRNA interferase family)
MKMPRDISGDQLVKALGKFGYAITRQTGSHMRLTTQQRGEHHITIPRHDPLKIGTLSGILGDVATHFELNRSELVTMLFS